MSSTHSHAGPTFYSSGIDVLSLITQDTLTEYVNLVITECFYFSHMAYSPGC